MCFQDWRIGRLIRSVKHDMTVLLNAAVAFPASQQRVGLLFSADPAGNAAAVEFDTQTPTAALGFTLAQFNPTLITLATHGDLPTHSFVIGSASAASVAICVVEFFAPEWLLHEGIEEIMRHYKH